MARLESDQKLRTNANEEWIVALKNNARELLQTKLELTIEYRDLIGPLLKRIPSTVKEATSRRASIVESIRSLSFGSRKNSINANQTQNAGKKFTNILWAILSAASHNLSKNHQQRTSSSTENVRLSTDLRSYKSRQQSIQDFEIIKRISRGAYGYACLLTLHATVIS